MGNGWELVSSDWTYQADTGRDGLRIELRLYSFPYTDENASTDYFVDNVTITAPDHATIEFAGVPEPTSMILLGLGGVLFARRK